MARYQGWFALVLALAIAAGMFLVRTPLELGLDLRGGGSGILFARKLKHQLAVANGLKRGLRHTQTIHTSVEHGLDGLHFFSTDPSDLSSWHHLDGELAATAKVKTKFQRCADQKHPGSDGQGKNEGKPPLITRHQCQMSWLIICLAVSTI